MKRKFKYIFPVLTYYWFLLNVGEYMETNHGTVKVNRVPVIMMLSALHDKYISGWFIRFGIMPTIIVIDKSRS